MRRPWVARAITLVLAPAFVAGCARYPVNPSQDSPSPSGYYIHDAVHDQSDSLLVVLAFSGGGTRAAAMAYGVLKKLRDTHIVWDGRRRRLLDEVDIISAVSGGSFTAAYYGLFGEQIFEGFESQFLKRDVQGALIRRFLNPWNWARLWSGRYHRSELAANYFDEILFAGKTFGDIQRRVGPFIQINATDVGQGAQFGFDQAQFDLLCSDVSSFPVSRAVAASAAVPLIFSAVTLRNHADQCTPRLPPWARQALRVGDPQSRAYQLAVSYRLYLDTERTRFIHLLDGGLTDNLGIRPILNLVSTAGGAWPALKALRRENTHRMVMIFVNAQSGARRDLGKLEKLPLTHTLGSAASVPLNSYSFETLSLVRELLVGWDAQITVGRCWEFARRGQSQADCFDIDHFLIEVGFDQIEDPDRRERLATLPTSLRLDDRQVDALIETAASVLDGSADFQRLIAP